jgi:hypothetical protein
VSLLASAGAAFEVGNIDWFHSMLASYPLLYKGTPACAAFIPLHRYLVPASLAVCTAPALVLTVLAEPSLLAAPFQQAHFMHRLAGQSTRLGAPGSALG